MDIDSITNDQWLVLDLLSVAREAGRPYVLRQEILQSTKIKDGAKLRIVMAALLIDPDLMEIRNDHEFHITEAGLGALSMRFGIVEGESIRQTHGIEVDQIIDLPTPGGRFN